MPTIARVSGVGLRPGVSLNNRLYTKPAIKRMVERANKQLQAGDSSLTTLTHHAAGDDSTRIVGRLTKIWQDQESGDMRYTADIADTEHGRTIAALLDDTDGKPYLSGVSIRGAWADDPRLETVEGREVETGDDLALFGLDYTASPGVQGARVTSFERLAESAGAAVPAARLISESAPAALVEAVKKPYGDDVAYADPGYLDKDGKAASKDSPGVARYPLGSAKHAKAAWSYINQEQQASQYSSAQLKRIKGRIKSALTKYGVKVTAEGWLMDAPVLVESSTDAVLLEYEADGDPQRAGSYSISLTNGPTTVSIYAYCLDPHDLQAVGRTAMDAAVKAIAAIDPDLDGDMDIPGAPGPAAPDDDADESVDVDEGQALEENAPEDLPEGADPAPGETAEQTAAAETDTEEVAVSDTTQAAAETEATTTTEPSGIDVLSAKFDQLTSAITGLVTKMAAPVAPAPAPAEAAPAAPVAEAAPAPVAPAPVAPAPVAETEDQRIARLVQEGVTRTIQGLAETGQLGLQRKGLTQPVNETNAGVPGAGVQVSVTEFGVPSNWPQKPLSKYTAEERTQFLFPALEGHVLGARARQ